MTGAKHVLILTVLILPMLVLAPSLVASPTEALSNQPVDDFLPAQFVEESLRVAVYAEDNTTLPTYASGGVITAYHANLIQFLESEGYAVTALSTQDILDHKLMAAQFDAFVLPNNLPRDEIVNLVKDYYLAGGGILSFDSAIGYLYYYGLLVSGETGSFGLLNVDPIEHWGYGIVENVTVGAHHSTAKSYQQADIIPIGENTTVHDRAHFTTANLDDFVPLLIESTDPSTTIAFALDNTERIGGRIVQLPGNCSTIPSWEQSIITDSIDWLAPRPSARIAIDYTHVPFYGVDAWDTNVTHVPRYDEWRNLAVNRSFTFDKLYPKGSAALTAADIAPFDVLIIGVQSINYTAAEMSILKTWVQNGGSLFILGDYVNNKGQENLNLLMADWGLHLNRTTTNMGTFSTSTLATHPIFEGVINVYMSGGKWINVTGSAESLVTDGPNTALAVVEPGDGRVILSGDINFLDDGHIISDDNIPLSVNILHWLAASQARVLVYADSSANPANPNFVRLNGPVAQALNDLRISYFLTGDRDIFQERLSNGSWDLVVFDNNFVNTLSFQSDLVDFVAAGGKLIFSSWTVVASVGVYFGVSVTSTIGDPPALTVMEPGHPLFSLPAPYGESTINTTLDLGYGTDGLNMTTYANATAIGGYADYAGVSIAIGVNNRVIVNGAVLTIYNEDTDSSTYPDNVEIWENEIAFLYFDRPTIDHPADVTYMETETGNEITWTPSVGAGAWEYVFRVNGSVVERERWYGGPLTFSVDGVNASISEYELTVYDILGYSVSDTVMLNVTPYVQPPITPFDPTLLVIVGGAIAAVLVIVVLYTKKMKKD